MIPLELECIAKELTKRYQSFVNEDGESVMVGDLLSAEEQVRDFVYKLGLDMLQAFVDVRTEQAKNNRAPCQCGHVASVHRITTWTRKTLFGPVVVCDPYIYCPDCNAADRPLHSLLGTDRETWSLVVQEAAVDLVSDESCGKAVAKLMRHHPGVEMERTTALRMLHEHGKEARAFINDKLAAAKEVVAMAPELRPPGTAELEGV